MLKEFSYIIMAQYNTLATAFFPKKCCKWCRPWKMVSTGLWAGYTQFASILMNLYPTCNGIISMFSEEKKYNQTLIARAWITWVSFLLVWTQVSVIGIGFTSQNHMKCKFLSHFRWVWLVKIVPTTSSDRSLTV